MPEELKYNVTVLDPSTGHPLLFRKGEQYTDGTTGIPTWAASLMLNDDLWVDGTAPFDPPPPTEYASLEGGKILQVQLPAIAIGDTFEVADEAALLALDAQRGDIAVRADNSQTYRLKGDDPSDIDDWIVIGGAGGGGASSVAQLTDVDLETYPPEDYYILVYATVGEEPKFLSAPLDLNLIGVASASQYQFDTNLSLSNGDILEFDSSLGDDGKFKAAMGVRPRLHFASTFESASRFETTNTGGDSAATVGNAGLHMNAGAAGGVQVLINAGDDFSGLSPSIGHKIQFATVIDPDLIDESVAYLGLGYLADETTAYLADNDAIGFQLTQNGADLEVRGFCCNPTDDETFTAMLVVATPQILLSFETDNDSVSFYVNGNLLERMTAGLPVSLYRDFNFALHGQGTLEVFSYNYSQNVR